MEQTQAASSPAEVVDVFNGETPTLAEYQQYRQSGEVPARFKAEPADPAPADPPKEDDAEPEEAEAAPESDPEETQEQPQKGSAAEKRIKQLLARNKELERQLAAPKQTQSDPSPARPQQPQIPQTFDEWQSTFNPTQWIEEYAKAHPDASYEQANFQMAVHVGKVQKHFDAIEQRVNAEKQALDSKVNEARERYEDFDEIKSTFLEKVVSDKGTPLIPLQVLGIINDSDVLPDLLYTIGSDEQELEKFVAMAKANPNKAIRYVAKVESLIAEELAKPKDTPARGNDGKFIAPEKRQTAAPKPPSPVGGGTSRAFDVSDENLSPEEWMRQRNAQIAKRRG